MSRTWDPQEDTDELRYKGYLGRVQEELGRLTDGEIDDVDDLPDFDYRAFFEDGASAKEAAKAAIDAAGGF